MAAWRHSIRIEGGVVSAGGVGFDISCGVRTMLTGLSVRDITPDAGDLAESLYRQIPAGLGSTGAITLDAVDMDAMLVGRRPLGRRSRDGVRRATLSGSRSEA